MGGWKGVEGWGRRAILSGWPLRILSFRFHNRTFSFFAFALLPSERPVRGVSRQDPLIFDLGGLFSPQGMV